jgi:LPS export ABC transporter protein LptC
MRRWRWLLALAVVGLLVAGAYFAGISQQARTDDSKPNEADTSAYDYEANTVTVRQMDEEGRLQYEVQAEHVAQLPRDGAVIASKLTMHYDPPGSNAKDESNRWKLTADSAQLPENSDIVGLRGNVVVRGRPPQSPGPVTFTAQSMDYNLETQDLHIPGAFRFDWAGNRMSGSGLRANIKQGDYSVESSANGQIAP